MISQILRQLWRQRRSSTWIWIELIVATYFLWVVIDPVYVLMANRAIDDGYQLEDTYRLNINEYKSTHRLYQSEMSSDSVRVENFLRIFEKVKQYPGVVAASIAFHGSFPQSDFWSSDELLHDTLKGDMQSFWFVKGTDYLDVFRIPLISKTNQGGQEEEPDEHSVYITQALAGKLFRKHENPIGQYVLTSDSVSFRVTGILPRIQTRSMEQPYPLCIFPTKLAASSLPGDARIIFRVRDGLASTTFAENFKKELRPQLKQGNFFLESLTSFPTISQQFEYTMGTTGTFRLQSGLAIFFLLCTFLGVSGTFWLRCNARRDEIGVRMALGSNQKVILRQFLTEAWLLVTVGFIVGVFIVLQQVIADGFAQATRNGDPIYLQNQPVAHFFIVSAITYLLLLVTALIGTWIPASRASRISPSEALRSE